MEYTALGLPKPELTDGGDTLAERVAYKVLWDAAMEDADTNISALGGDSLPDQTGHNGEVLGTNGTVAAWTPAGAGDMLAATYDPQAIGDDAFDRANHTGSNLWVFVGLADHGYISNDLIQGTIGTSTLSPGQLVYQASNGKWELGRANAIATMSNHPRLVGIGGAPDAEATLMGKGFYRDDSLDADTVGGKLYVDADTAGKVTKNAPAVGEFQQILGKLVYSSAGTKIIEFDPEKTIMEVGTGTIDLASEVTGVLPEGNGGAGEVNGILKANGLGTVSQAAAGTDYATPSGTETFTNKRVTKRVGQAASSATPTINTDNYDAYELTAQAADITSFSTNLSGTPVNGDYFRIAITGTASRAITWGAKFESSTITLPTTTDGTNRLDVGFIYNGATSKWRCIAVA